MPVVAIRKASAESARKIVPATQKDINALPFDSGMWTVQGCPGLFVRCRAQSKSFLVQRRVHGKLVKQTLGELSVKQAKERAMKIWGALKPKPAAGEVVTLGIATERYLEQKTLADKTRNNYRYNSEHYLIDWRNRSLRDVGDDRAGFRFHVHQIRKKHGAATYNQVVRLVSAIYNWQRKIDPTLPESPTIAVEVESIPARNWGYSDEELRSWWYATRKEKDGTVTELGVKTLGPIKRMWWLTALFTGARKGSIEALRWRDVDFERKRIFFFVVKGDRPYVVPMSDKLAALLIRYRDGGDVPPSDWVFPSSVREGNHIVDVKNDREGVGPAHRLRHTFKTTLTDLGVTTDQSRLLMGHSMRGDVSRDYITAPLVVNSLREITNVLAQRYINIIGLD